MHVRTASIIGLSERRRRPGRRPVAAVIGGAGFIGSHVCETLLGRGREVVCLDNFRTGSPRNLSALIDEPRALVISHDPARRPIPDDLPRFDEIYHLAGSPLLGAEQARLQARAALHILERAAQDGARVLMASPWGSEAAPAGPASGRGRPPFHAGRADWRAAEDLFIRCAARRHVHLKVARFFCTYGPRMALEARTDVAGLVTSALRGEVPCAGGGGRETRLLCFVADVAEGCLRLMEAEVAGPILIAEPTAVTGTGLAKAVQAVAGSAAAPFVVEENPAPGSAEPPAGTAGLLRLPGPPPTSLDEGLRRTIADFAARLGMSAPSECREAPALIRRRTHA